MGHGRTLRPKLQQWHRAVCIYVSTLCVLLTSVWLRLAQKGLWGGVGQRDRGLSLGRWCLCGASQQSCSPGRTWPPGISLAPLACVHLQYGNAQAGSRCPGSPLWWHCHQTHVEHPPHLAPEQGATAWHVPPWLGVLFPLTLSRGLNDPPREMRPSPSPPGLPCAQFGRSLKM